MKPDTIAALLDIPQVRELVVYFQSEANKLNDLSIFATLPAAEYDGEVRARLRAKQVIDAMLAPLLQHVDNPGGTDPNEFVV